MKSIYSHKVVGSSPKVKKRCKGERRGGPLKTQKAPAIKDFELLVKFWKRQSDVMLRIVMLLPMVAVKLSLTLRRKAKLHLRSELHCQRQLHLPVRANLVEKSTCFRKCFFLAPRTGLEPVTSCIPLAVSCVICRVRPTNSKLTVRSRSEQ